MAFKSICELFGPVSDRAAMGGGLPTARARTRSNLKELLAAIIN